MNSQEEKDFELILAYFDAQLSQEEMSSFENRLMDDVDFAEKVELYAKSIAIVDEIHPESEEQLRKKEWKELLQSEPKSQMKSMSWIVRIAAVFIVGMSTVFYFYNSEPDSGQLLEKAWEKEVGLDFILRGTINDSTAISLSKALKIFKSKKYQEVLTLLQPFDTTSKSFKEVLLLRALTQYQLQQIDLALTTLDSLETYAPQEAQWYKGLIYLETQEVEKAKDYIHIPSDSKGEIKLKQ